jgi:hypothetical protein
MRQDEEWLRLKSHKVYNLLDEVEASSQADGIDYQQLN